MFSKYVDPYTRASGTKPCTQSPGSTIRTFNDGSYCNSLYIRNSPGFRVYIWVKQLLSVGSRMLHQNAQTLKAICIQKMTQDS